MSSRKQYRKKPTETVVAVQLDLNTTGFTYKKWGGTQVCKPGDWLVDNKGDVYTIDEQSFAETYEKISTGLFYKSKSVWAEVAETSGVIQTKEGSTAYQAGDYLVYNAESGEDGYAISRDRFEGMYDRVGDIE